MWYNNRKSFNYRFQEEYMAGFHDIIGHDMVKDAFTKRRSNTTRFHMPTFCRVKRDGKKDDRQGICHDTALRKSDKGTMYAVPLLQTDYVGQPSGCYLGDA